MCIIDTNATNSNDEKEIKFNMDNSIKLSVDNGKENRRFIVITNDVCMYGWKTKKSKMMEITIL